MNANRLNVLLCCTFALVFSAIGCGGVGASSHAPSPTPSPSPGGNPSPTPTPSSTSAAFIYIANNGSTQNVGGSIAGFRINLNDGSLAPVPGSPFKAGNGPSAIGSDPQGHFVFVGEDGSVPGARGNNCTLGNSTLLSERVDPASGTLTQADQKTVSGNCIRAIRVDPTGRNVYVGVGSASGVGGEIHGYIIGPTGTLSEFPGSPVKVSDLPLSLEMHPSGKFVYAATPNLTVLDRDPATGILTVRGVFNTPKRALALNPAGNLLVASESGSNEVSEFHIDGSGNVIAVDQRVPASDPFGVAADPQGQFFAITEITDTTNFAGGLSLLKLNSVNGEYTKVNSTPFGNGGAPLDLAFEPTGKFVYSVFHNDGTVGGFVLDRNSSTLTAIPAKPFASGDNPVSLTIAQPR